MTPLHTAVNVFYKAEDFKPILDLLVLGGCHINSRAYSTLETPLYRAVDTSKNEIAELLLQCGANPNIASPFDMTVLYKACQKGNAHLVHLLLSSGIDWSNEKWLEKHRPITLSIKMELYRTIQEFRCQVPTLLNSCRSFIRDCLSDCIATKVDDLLLPNRLKAFILLK